MYKLNPLTEGNFLKTTIDAAKNTLARNIAAKQIHTARATRDTAKKLADNAIAAKSATGAKGLWNKITGKSASLQNKAAKTLAKAHNQALAANKTLATRISSQRGGASQLKNMNDVNRLNRSFGIYKSYITN